MGKSQENVSSAKEMMRPPTTPGEFLIEEFLKPLAITQASFAATIGVSAAYISDIVKGRRGVSAEMALRFEAALGMPADFWLSAQAATDIYQAQQDPKANTKRKKIRYLQAA